MSAIWEKSAVASMLVGSVNFGFHGFAACYMTFCREASDGVDLLKRSLASTRRPAHRSLARAIATSATEGAGPSTRGWVIEAFGERRQTGHALIWWRTTRQFCHPVFASGSKAGRCIATAMHGPSSCEKWLPLGACGCRASCC